MNCKCIDYNMRTSVKNESKIANRFFEKDLANLTNEDKERVLRNKIYTINELITYRVRLQRISFNLQSVANTIAILD